MSSDSDATDWVQIHTDEYDRLRRERDDLAGQLREERLYRFAFVACGFLFGIALVEVFRSRNAVGILIYLALLTLFVWKTCFRR